MRREQRSVRAGPSGLLRPTVYYVSREQRLFALGLSLILWSQRISDLISILSLSLSLILSFLIIDTRMARLRPRDGGYLSLNRPRDKRYLPSSLSTAPPPLLMKGGLAKGVEGGPVLQQGAGFGVVLLSLPPTFAESRDASDGR